MAPSPTPFPGSTACTPDAVRPASPFATAGTPRAAKKAPKSKDSRRAGRPLEWNRARRATFEDYVAVVQHHLKLENWTVGIDWSHCPDDACAEIARWPNQRRATMALGRGFLELSPRDQRNTVVHELAHCLLFDLHDVAATSVSGLEGDAARLAEVLINAQVELATDRLASLLERGVPTPRW